MSIRAIQTNSPSFKAVLTPVAQAYIGEAYNDVLKNGTKNEIRDAALYYSEIHSTGTANGWKLNAVRTASRDAVSGENTDEEYFILKRPEKFDRVILKTTSKEPMSPFDKLRNLALDLTLRAKTRYEMSEKEAEKEITKLSNKLKKQGVQGISITALDD